MTTTQVKSSLTNRETFPIFVSYKEALLDHMISHVMADFGTLSMIGERIVDGKTGKLIDAEALQTMVEKQSENIQKKVNWGRTKKERRCVNIFSAQVARKFLPIPTPYCPPTLPPYLVYELPPPIHT